MTSRSRIRTLESTPFETLHRAFNEAFADYVVSFAMTEAQMAELHRRRGVRHDLSVGAFEGERLVGFTFNGLGPWMGAPAGYDAGTGVVPSARGEGLAADLMERSLDLLGAAGAGRYVLEVIQSNETAFRVYERMGFAVTRELGFWSLDDAPASRNANVEIEIRSTIPPDASRMWNWMPTWQNSTESLERAEEPRRVLCAIDDGHIVGYAVVFDSGDLAQFAVAKDQRRRGIGTALVGAARDLSTKPLRISNTDMSDDPSTHFVRSLGAIETVRQYEMVREI